MRPLLAQKSVDNQESVRDQDQRRTYLGRFPTRREPKLTAQKVQNHRAPLQSAFFASSRPAQQLPSLQVMRALPTVLASLAALSRCSRIALDVRPWKERQKVSQKHC